MLSLSDSFHPEKENMFFGCTCLYYSLKHVLERSDNINDGILSTWFWMKVEKCFRDRHLTEKEFKFLLPKCALKNWNYSKATRTYLIHHDLFTRVTLSLGDYDVGPQRQNKDRKLVLTHVLIVINCEPKGVPGLLQMVNSVLQTNR